MRALGTLASRGPDDRGVWSEGGAVLAHLRLAIIDVSPAGHQPMFSADERYVLVYNGEIYNYRELRDALDAPGQVWRSDSDSEVILAAYARWGKSFLSRLRGMFAIALWDRQERRLLLARDRLGVKPLYYACHGEGLIFASRPRALFAYRPELPDELDLQGLSLYLEAGYFPAPHTLHAAVRKLPAGHLLEFAEGRASVAAYWSPLEIEPAADWRDRPEEDLLDELDALLRRSVRSRLVSDVPLGAFLSGGIDSSLVVALMSRLSAGPVKTFTIGFHEPAYDESRHASAVAQAVGTAHHQEVMSVDELTSLLPDFGEHFDEPFFDSSAFPALAVSRLARRQVTVALGGDGGDEVFGGYHYYSVLRRLAPAYHLPPPLRAAIARMISLLPAHRARLLAGALRERGPLQAFRFMRSIAKDFGAVLLPGSSAAGSGLDGLFAPALERMPDGLSPVEAAMRLDLTHILPEEYLQKTDLSSMAYSLEAREPLLDHELVEWGMKLPLCWKLRDGDGKYLLRRLAERYLPRALLDRPKQGFTVPIDRWLRGQLREWARERLQDDHLYQRFPLDRGRVLALFELHLSGRRDAHPLLWALLMLSPFAHSPGGAVAR